MLVSPRFFLHWHRDRVTCNCPSRCFFEPMRDVYLKWHKRHFPNKCLAPEEDRPDVIRQPKKARKKGYPSSWQRHSKRTKKEAGYKCIRCNEPNNPEIGHQLTVHHFDGNKLNNGWWNLMALCEDCHRHVELWESPDHLYGPDCADWIKPYLAGLYARRYLGHTPKRAEVIERVEEFLSLPHQSEPKAPPKAKDPRPKNWWRDNAPLTQCLKVPELPTT